MCRGKNFETILVGINVARDLNGSLFSFSTRIERNGKTSIGLKGEWSLMKGIDWCYVTKVVVTGEGKELTKERR